MRKFSFFLIFVLFICSRLCYAIPQSADNQIRLGSFNIEKLGKENTYQARNAAEILKNYDIVAIQEVMNMGATRLHPIGTKGIEALKQIVSCLGEGWDYVVSPDPNGTASANASKAFNTFEYYAFIYRKSKIELIQNSAHLWNESENPIPSLNNQERQFDREPFIASFKARNGKLDFTLITIHAAQPSAKWRKDEIKRLQIVYDTVQASDPNQNDVVAEFWKRIFIRNDSNTVSISMYMV